MSKNTIIFFICVFFHYKKKIRVFIEYIKFFFNEIIVLNYFLNLVFGLKKNIFKSKELNIFLNKNMSFWKNKKYKISKQNKSILVENFVNQPAYTMSNAIISQYLKKIYNYNIIGLLRDGDYIGEAIFKSYEINEIYYYKDLSLIQRLKTISISLKLIKNSYKIEDFCKIKFKDLNVGLSSYDSYIRYTGKPSLKFINSELIYFLSNSIGSSIFFENFIKDKKIKLSVQAETAFSPLNNLFQTCLKNKIKVFSRLGTDSFSIRIYKNWKERFTYRANFAQKIFNKIYNNHKLHCVKKYEFFFNKDIKDGRFGYDVSVSDKLIKKKLINRQNLQKLFNWDNKKIAVVFLHHFIDGNFHCGPRKSFKDNYSWAKFTLNCLPKIKNVNWIIKPHPSQYVYKTQDNLENEINFLIKNYKHIRMFPRELSQSSLLNITDFAITSHGTVAVEYLAYGANSIYCDNSFYSNLNFMKMTKGSKNYFRSLNNLNSKKKPSKDLIKKAKTFLYIRHHLVKSDCSLLSEHSITRNLKRELFWKQNTRRLKKFTFDKDELYNMFIKQLKLNLEHTINFNKLKIKI